MKKPELDLIEFRLFDFCYCFDIEKTRHIFYNIFINRTEPFSILLHLVYDRINMLLYSEKAKARKE